MTVCILYKSFALQYIRSQCDFRKKKEVMKVVLLDELKTRLSAYEEPLKDLRDSL